MGLANLLRQRALVERLGALVDGAGDVRQQWTVVHENMPCAVERRLVDLMLDAGGEATGVRGRIYAPAEWPDPPDANDRVTVAGERWRVLSSRLEEGPRETVRVLEAARMSAGE